MRRLIVAISVTLFCRTILAAPFEEALRALREACGDKPGGGEIEFKKAGWTVTSFHQGGTGIHLTDSDVGRISRLGSLEEIWLGGDIEVKLESWKRLASLPRLTQVSVPVTSMKMFSVLTAFPRLESIDLSELPLPAEAALAELKKFQGLRKLSLPGGITDADLDRVVELKSLEELDFEGSFNVTDAGIARLAALHNVRSLRVNALGHLGRAALAHLPHLQRLTILKGAGDELDLSDWQNLRSLTLGTDATRYRGAVRLPNNLRELNVWAWTPDDAKEGTFHIDAAPPKRIEGVQLLFFPICPIQDRPEADLRWLNALPALAEVTITNPTNKEVAVIAKLAGLRVLKLVGNNGIATDDDLLLIARLGTLEVLEITTHTKITDAGVEALGKLTKLRRLECSGLPIESIAGGRLWKLTALESLRLYLRPPTPDQPIAKTLAGIVSLSELRDLKLRGTVDDGGVKVLGALKKLQRLDLSGSDGFKDAALADLVKLLPELKTVGWSCDPRRKP